MRKNHTYQLMAFLTALFVMAQTVSAQYTIPPKMKWWYEARFGMFIHFGSYSQLGYGEWNFSVDSRWTKATYQTRVSAKFNPVNFDATAIAKLAKNAGMKYLVITAKHHEGFCMWNTEVKSFKDVTGTKMYSLPGFTDFNKRDVLKELKDACDAQGIKFCLYYSIMDWSHSSQEIDRKTYYSTMASDSARTQYIIDMKAQLKELVTQYHPAIMWFDGDWTYNSGKPTLSSWWTKSDGMDLYNYLIGLDPTLIVNERVARSFGLGDFECPEQKVPEAPLERQWETNQTMNHSWGYNMGDKNYKSSKSLVNELVKVVSRDGNYLLNIGPKGDGSVPGESVLHLTDVGNWMRVNGESVYGTSRSPFFREPEWGFFTKKQGKLYIHICNWPSDGQLTVTSLTNKINKIYLLSKPSEQLKYSANKERIRISIPINAPDTINTVIVMDLVGVPTAAFNDCSPTSITPYIQVNSGEWQQKSEVAISAGDNVILGPQPFDGGSWAWSGPDGNGFSAKTREVRFDNFRSAQAGNYMATFTNVGGCKSKVAFVVKVN